MCWRVFLYSMLIPGYLGLINLVRRGDFEDYHLSWGYSGFNLGPVTYSQKHATIQSNISSWYDLSMGII